MQPHRDSVLPTYETSPCLGAADSTRPEQMLSAKEFKNTQKGNETTRTAGLDFNDK